MTHHELTDQTSGIVPVFVDFVDQVEQRYLGVDAEAMPEFSDADLSRKQKGRLSKKVLELGKLSTFVSKWQLQTEYYDLSGTKYHGRQTLTDYIQSEVLQWCVGPSTTEDKLILLHMALRL